MPPTVIEASGGIPPEHYAAIGMVASNWAGLEILIDSAIWALSGMDDEEGACLTAQFGSIGRRLDAFNALIRLREGSAALIGKINAFTKAAHDTVKERNRIIHDPWVREKHTGAPHRFQVTADPRPVMKYKLVPTDDVIAVADRIADLVDQFDDLIRKDVIGELGPLRRTRPAPSAPPSQDSHP
jgi:hypothetical protein